MPYLTFAQFISQDGYYRITSNNSYYEVKDGTVYPLISHEYRISRGLMCTAYSTFMVQAKYEEITLDQILTVPSMEYSEFCIIPYSNCIPLDCPYPISEYQKGDLVRQYMPINSLNEAIQYFLIRKIQVMLIPTNKTDIQLCVDTKRFRQR